MLPVLFVVTLVAASTPAHAVDLMGYLRIVTARMTLEDQTAEVWFQVSTASDFPIEEVEVSCVLKDRFGRPAGKGVTIVRNIQNQRPVTGRPRILLAEADGEVPKSAACRILAAR